MSTFGGRLWEIPSVSIDRFDGINLASKAFFLSHCHTDHMVGLDNPDGLPGPLYLTEVSAVIVRRQFPNIKQLVTLSIGVPTLVTFEDDNGNSKIPSRRLITVTTIPAAHCPGSAMFLFEEFDLKVLYTGDFRLRLKELQKIVALKDVNGARVHIHCAYIDSTFFHRDYEHFPTQHDSTDIVCKLVEQWLQRSPEHKVSLRTCARYGYESLFKCIYDRLRLPIHVNHSELLQYQYVPELDDCFTSDSASSRIHACFSASKRKCRQLCCDPAHDTNKILVILPSAMAWKKWQQNQTIHKQLEKQFVRVCYSNHASYTEIRDLLLYLKPKVVKLNVVPTCVADKATMKTELQSILDEYQTEDVFDLNADLDTLNSRISFSHINCSRPIRKAMPSYSLAIEDGDVPVTSLQSLPKRQCF